MTLGAAGAHVPLTIQAKNFSVNCQVGFSRGEHRRYCGIT